MAPARYQRRRLFGTAARTSSSSTRANVGISKEGDSAARTGVSACGIGSGATVAGTSDERVTAAMKRYPRRGRVSTYRGLSHELDPGSEFPQLMGMHIGLKRTELNPI